MPKISVILTSFNHARFVREAIDSVLAQDFSDFELIVWDDASTDGSWEIIESYSDPRMRAFRNDQTRRAIYGINTAISELAQGEYIAIHHSDDAWEPDKLSRQVAFLDANAEIGAVFTDASAVSEDGSPYPDPEHFYATVFAQPNRSRFEWLRHFFYHGNALCHPSVLIRKSCYAECGLYRYGFGQVGDLDMWIRLCLKHEIHVLPEKLVRFRVLRGEANTSGSRSDTRVRWITEMFRLMLNYRRLKTWGEMIAVFPEAAEYHRRRGFEPDFVLAMMAMREHPFHFTKLFGLELLFDLVQNETKAKRIASLYGFDYRDLIALTAKHDVFSHEYSASLAAGLKERDAQIVQLLHDISESARSYEETRTALAQREADVEHMHRAVHDRNERLAALGSTLSERDQRLASLREELSRQEAEAAGLNRALAERDRRMSELETKAAEAESVAAAARQEGFRAKAQAELLRGQLEEVEARGAQLSQDLEARACDLHHMHQQVARRDETISRLSSARQDLELQLHLARGERDRIAYELASLRREMREAEGRLETRMARAVTRWPRGFLQRRRIEEWRRALADCELFVPDWYRAAHPDVAAAGVDPLEHYLDTGWKEGRDPGPEFDSRYYVRRYSDMAQVQQPALVHYWIHGRNEGRFPNQAKEDEHRKYSRWQRRLQRCPLFDPQWYLAENPDVAATRSDPAWHYAEFGWKEGRRPGPEFDEEYYRKRYPDVAGHDEPLVLHYWRRGRFEGRHPNAALDFEQLQATQVPPEMVGEEAVAAELAALEGRREPFISVVIPTYNRIKLLPSVIEAWRGVAKVTRFPFEILFSDDGSTDGSVEYLESVKDLPIRVLRNDHGGPSRARNAAIQVAVGERLFITGDDIYPDPDILNVHAALGRLLGPSIATLGLIDWHPDVPMNHLMHHITDIGNEQFSFNRLPDGGLTDFRHFYTSNVCIDRALVLSSSPVFDERFDRAAFEDIELAYRLALGGLRLFYTSRARSTHYHPYTIDGFSRRQSGAGSMAVVFSRMHPAAERVLEVCAIARAARKLRRVCGTDAAWKPRLDALVDRCRLYEDMVAQLPMQISRGVRERLTAIYVRLFRAMYEYGALQRQGAAQPLAAAMSHVFDERWEPYWAAIERAQPLPDPRPADLYRVAEALLERRDDLYARWQRTLVAELRLVTPQAFNAEVGFKDPGVLQHALPALVLERDDPDRARAAGDFRAVFGSAARIFEHGGGGRLAELAADGSRGAACPAGLVEASALYWPTRAAHLLPADHLLGAFLALVENGVDLAVVSHALEADAGMRGRALRDQAFFSRRVAQAMFARGVPAAPFTGKLLRLLPGPEGARDMPLEAAFGSDVKLRPDGSFASAGAEPAAPVHFEPGYLPPRPKGKPVVFVFPIFLAVGGVERNTVEIMRKLNDRFDFVVVSMERLRAEQGSLAGQAMEVAARVVEMAEIVDARDFLRVLHELKRSYDPDLVWVCNGSPWFCDHAAEIRALFADVPIVDQEAYDVNAGWINRYGEPGIRSFDRHIAVNRKIERKFLTELDLDPQRTHLIYSAVDAQRIRAFKRHPPDAEAVRAKLGLPAGRTIVSFVARLTAQKRPLAFLELARRRLPHANECFCLVGDGELAPEVAAFIEEHGLSNVVRHRYIENTLELHLVSHGLVFTSAYEGLPIAMIEALAMGVPVFSTDVGDIADVLQEYGAGCVVPVEADADEMERGFAGWMERREEYAARMRQEEERLLEQFSSDHISRQYASLFQGAMARYGRV